MSIYIAVPTLHKVWGGITKLLDYASHLSSEYKTFVVNFLDSGNASVCDRYSNTKNIIDETRFRKNVKPEDCILFAPTTQYRRLKNIKARLILVEMGFAGRNFDFDDSTNVLDEIKEIICIGEQIALDVQRTCGEKFTVIPAGLDLNKYCENTKIRVSNLISIYADEKYRIPIAAKGSQKTGTFEMAAYINETILPSYGLKRGRDYTFKIINRNSNYTESQMINLYQKTDIFVSLSCYEGTSAVVTEAMSCGCAIVFADAKGVDVAIPWKTVLRVTPNNVNKAATAIRKMLTDKALREKIRRQAKTEIKKYSLEQEKQKLLAYFNENI